MLIIDFPIIQQVEYGNGDGVHLETKNVAVEKIDEVSNSVTRVVTVVDSVTVLKRLLKVSMI